MRRISADERVFGRFQACSVWAGYTVTIAPDQFEKLRRALGADVVDLVCNHVEAITARGARTWLDDQGIERGFHAY